MAIRFGTSRRYAELAVLCLVLFLVMTPGCDKETTTGPIHGDTSTGLLSHSSCKDFTTSSALSATPSNRDCIEYELKGDGTLHVRHVNAAFNCCIDDIAADITISNDTITVVEREELTTPCFCLCLYDLEYRFADIEPGTYVLIVVEPYTETGDAPLSFTVDLSTTPSGTYCVDRDHYPWAMGSGEPRGSLIAHTGCKSASPGAFRTVSAAEDCIEYEYVGYNTIAVTHVNAGFNCCPGDITADITIRNDTVTVVEHESQSGCRCLCLYDVEYRFENMEPAVYTFIFVEPYANASDAPLACTIDFVATPTGSCCVGRGHYPWDTGAGSIGTLLSHTGCKSGLEEYDGERIPSDMDCIEYHYVGSTLGLKHINAAFNCCPGDITADITVAGGVITIVEHEADSMCDCICLYDVEYEITNLEPAAYIVRVIGLYLHPNDPPLEFPIDLSATPACFLARYRDHYPWGYLGTQPEDQATLYRMRGEIIALIGTPSCTGQGDCRYIALGAKPCGGPWEYLIYSRATVDELTLRFKVSKYNAFNGAYNRRYNISSDCMVVPPPRVGCVGGICTDLNRAAQ
jgi:hypothetical protein